MLLASGSRSSEFREAALLEFIGVLSYANLTPEMVQMIRTSQSYDKLEKQLGKRIDDPAVIAAAERQASQLYARAAAARAKKQRPQK